MTVSPGFGCRTTTLVPVVDPALREGADAAGDRWVLLTLGALSEGPRRFGDLLSDIDGIAPNMLTDRLRRMEREGLIVAAPYSHRPRRYVYDLTESGRELAAILPALAAWAGRRGAGSADAPRHDVCGTALERRAWCPNCATIVDPPPTGTSGSAGSTVDADLRWF